IIRRRSEQAGDGREAVRLDHLNHWGRAVRGLKGKPLKQLVYEKMVADGLMPSDSVAAAVPALTPEQTISAYFNAEFLHSDDEEAQLVETWAADPFPMHVQLLSSPEAAAGLAHVYIGFGLLVTAATGFVPMLTRV